MLLRLANWPARLPMGIKVERNVGEKVALYSSDCSERSSEYGDVQRRKSTQERRGKFFGQKIGAKPQAQCRETVPRLKARCSVGWIRKRYAWDLVTNDTLACGVRNKGRDGCTLCCNFLLLIFAVSIRACEHLLSLT